MTNKEREGRKWDQKRGRKQKQDEVSKIEDVRKGRREREMGKRKQQKRGSK